MFSKRGEISTIVVLGTLAVIAVAALINSTVTKQRNITNTQASGGNCRNNPENPPDGGYIWVASCNSTCTANTDCPKNTSDPGNVNPETSNWCYGFAEGAKCLQLQKDTGNNPTPETGNQTTNPTTQPVATTNAVCDKPEGCGGACNTGLNNGCGYGGCRAWEQCVNNTCIDTTNLGTQEAGANACRDLANAGAPQNIRSATQPTIPPNNETQNPTQTPSSNNGNTSTTPKATATRTPLPNGTRCQKGSECENGCCADGYCNTASVCQNSCSRSGQIKCPGTNVCADSQADCADLSIPLTPTPTRTSIYIPLFGTNNTPTPKTNPTTRPTIQNQNPLTPTPVPTREPIDFITDKEIIAKSCVQNNKFVWTWGCVAESGQNLFNSFNNE